MTPIFKGENILIRRNIQDKLGNPIPLEIFTSIQVFLEKKLGDILQTYTYPSANLRQGENNSQLELEITSTISESLPTGNIFLKYVFKKAESEFETELIFTDIIREHILEVSF